MEEGDVVVVTDKGTLEHGPDVWIAHPEGQVVRWRRRCRLVKRRYVLRRPNAAINPTASRARLRLKAPPR